jgi:uncharacterized membrane protein YhaH (DUF805 family)
MIESVKSGFAKYSDYKGRATRSEYWYWYLFTIILIALAGIIDVEISKTSSFITDIAELVILLPTICVGIRRMHDSGHRGWWILCPIVNFIFLLSPSVEDNQYGTRPYRRSN